MKFELVTQFDIFIALEKDWNDLLTRVDDPQIFYRHEWARAFIDTMCPDYKSKLSILVGRENNRCCLIFPFVIDNGIIRFVPSKTVDYNNVYVDANYDSYRTIKSAIRFLLEKQEIEGFDLSNIRASELLYNLEDVIRKNGFICYIEESVVAPAIIKGTKPSDFDKKQVKDIERREKNWVEKNGALEIVTTNTINEEILDFIIDTRNSKHPGNYLSDDVKIFYLQLSKHLKDNIYLNYIKYQDKFIAAHLGFIDKRKVYYFIPVYDEEYSKFAFGAILLNHLINDNIENREFDFLRGSEDYKYYYCNSITMNFSLYANKSERKVVLRRIRNVLKEIKFLRRLFKKDV